MAISNTIESHARPAKPEVGVARNSLRV